MGTFLRIKIMFGILTAAMDQVDDLPSGLVFALVLVGGWIVIKGAVNWLFAFYTYFVRPGKNMRDFGEWAVVTGASDGIGKAYATEFARAGMNVVLISRNQERLDAAAEEITGVAPNATIKVIAVDLGAGKDSGIYEDIASELEGLDIGVLVNNVGMSYDHAEYYHLLDDWRTKAYVDFFSRALNVEYAQYGVHVQCQIPFFVTTKLAKIRKSNLFIPTPASFARASITKIGYEASIVPYWSHAIQAYVFSWFPIFFANSKLMGDHLSLRKRALKRKAEKAAKNQ